MVKFFSSLPWYLKVLAGALLLVGVFALFGQVMSWRYDKERKEYQAERQQWVELERPQLIARAEASEKKVAELEPKAIAFDAVAEQNKKIDAGLAQQIEEVSKHAAEEEARAMEPTDCLTRVARVCERLQSAGIKHDCFAITRETCK
jgi:hypothetical protein